MTSPPPSLEERLARVEYAMARLSAEVAAIRAELVSPVARASGTERPSPTRTPTSESRRTRGRFVVDGKNLERLVGTYGMLGISVLAAVAAVGTFLSWAIGRGYLVLGPAPRVIIGLIFAAAIGAWGVGLRKRERSFGSSVMGLALVIVHVCAYAAGPAFDLVPTWVAFAGSAIVSWALALFSHIENDEPLWCVAFGGASIAPFVTSDGKGSIYALLLYGAVVLLSACFAISRRTWPVAWRVFYLASALYSISGALAVRDDDTAHFLAAFAFPLLIAVGGVTPFAAESRKRGAIRWLAILAVFTAFVREASGPDLDGWPVAGAMFAASCVCLFFADRHANVAQSSILERFKSNTAFLDWIDVAFIPLALALHAAFAVDQVSNPAGIYLASTATFLIFTWRRSVSPSRDAAAFGATIMLVAAASALPLERPTGRLIAFCIVALGALRMHSLRPSRSWVALGFLVLVSAAMFSVTALFDRPAYHPRPFFAESSLTALVVTVSLIIVARSWRRLREATRASIAPRPGWTYVETLRAIIEGATMAPWVWVFVWWLIELATAYSASASKLLLVTYFAATAVACVAVGRARRSSRLRQVGLGLALLSAVTAVYGANTYFDFGARIAAYLVTSAFLLGIAYWYRRPGSVPHPV